MILNGVVAFVSRYFSDIGSILAFGAHCIKLVEDIPKLSATEMQLRLLVLGIYHLGWHDVGNPSIGGGIKRNFWRIEGYISETVQDRK